jgi:transposase
LGKKRKNPFKEFCNLTLKGAKQMASTRISYCGRKVYIGIDVHKGTYAVTCICEQIIVKKSTVPADPEEFSQSILKWFKGAKIYTAYEAGFSGFGLHRKLDRHEEIKSIVVNAASIAVAANDKVKTDLRDSKKIAEQLSTNNLHGIYVPTEEEEARRTLTRTREQVVEARATASRQIKSKLHYFGLMALDDIRQITNRYLKQIEAMKLPADVALGFKILIEQWRFLTRQLHELRGALQKQAEKDNKLEKVYQSVPGIGLITSRTLANELGDLSRFENERTLFAYTGLTPSEHSSGPNVRRGHISKQGSARIRWLLVEAAWRAVSKDEALKTSFDRIAKTRGKKRAIVAIARKLIGRIRACFKSNTVYAVGTYA